MATLLDLSQKGDPSLGALIGRINAIVGKAPYLLAGATARDLLLQAAHGIDPRRATKDVDLAFMVDTWDEYQSLRAGLLNSGDFSEVPREGLHKLRFRGSLEVDIMPFGAIEKPDRSIIWPSPTDSVMTVFGYREAQKSCITVVLPPDERVQVVSLPALAILKLVAWKDRGADKRGKDAHDLTLIIKSYLDVGNHERLHDEIPDAGGSPYDYEYGGAQLLGKDMAKLLDAEGRERLGRLIADEADEQGQLRLAAEMMRHDTERALELLGALEEGFIGGSI